ncbi:MAG: helix-turn-helix domain-containing protein [Sedimenticola sp.]|nr:helix-turn-helix domain-containing protein [Sedimenticola sp.]
MNKKIGPTNASPNQQKHNTSSDAQRQRLLKALKQGPVTTLQARAGLDILCPATRIFELRHGSRLNITMRWIIQYTDQGQKHRVGEYSLEPGTYQGGA